MTDVSNMSNEYIQGIFEHFYSSFKNTFIVLKKGTRVKGYLKFLKKCFSSHIYSSRIAMNLSSNLKKRKLGAKSKKNTP